MTLYELWLCPSLPCFALMLFACVVVSSEECGYDKIMWRHVQFGQIFWSLFLSAIPILNVIAMVILVIAVTAEMSRDWYERLMSWRPFLKKGE